MEVSAWRNDLGFALTAALREIPTSEGPFGVLFSGGVDSSLLAWELRRHPGVLLCTLGREGSHDLNAGRSGAERLGLPWEAVPATRAEVEAADHRFSEELTGVPVVSRTVLLALAVAIDRCRPSRLVCGQGVDELFFGYAHYRGLDKASTERRGREDLDRLREVDWPRTLRIAERAGKSILAPYLSPDFVTAALRVPAELRLPHDHPKRFFREWALERGVPPELANRPKKALQYGSGISALVRELGRGRT